MGSNSIMQEISSIELYDSVFFQLGNFTDLDLKINHRGILKECSMSFWCK